jgi:methylenetetrahydrofolate dehydrogenase (NADP+)/methenyltetrahydrofolate cyclohydrolase
VSGTLLDGVALGKVIRAEVGDEVKGLLARGIKPGLAVVLCGEDPASQVYVRSKGKACEEAGMHSVTIRLPATTPQEELLATIDRLNADPAVHGMLVQLPLPKQMNSEQVLRRIDPRKDVDGFHPENVGKLVTGDPTAFRPATPYGVQQMLIRSGVETKGAHAVIVGRSNIVGKPMAQLLLREHCTVTIAHSRTRDLAEECRRAEILVTAIGRPRMVKGDWIRPGAAVIDVGINRVTLPTDEGPRERLVGDVDFESAVQVAGAITPVPGGVGPMTIACLLRNTVTVACAQHGIDPNQFQ